MPLDDGAVAFIRANYGSNLSMSQIADHLGVTKGVVAGKARSLGLTATREDAAIRAHRRREVAEAKAKAHNSAPKPEPEKIGWGRLLVPRPDPAETDTKLRERLECVDAAPEVDPPVRFVDRRETQCPAIRDHTAPILDRLVCGALKDVEAQWCAWHRPRMTTVPHVALKGLERLA